MLLFYHGNLSQSRQIVIFLKVVTQRHFVRGVKVMCDELGVSLKRFRELMDNSGKNRQEIAKIFGCDTSTITKHYNGDRGITTEQLIKYAKLFHVSADYLLGLSNAPTTDKNLQMICDYTGLSLAAVEVLHNKAYPLTLDALSDKLDSVDIDSTTTESAALKQQIANMGLKSIAEYKAFVKNLTKPVIDASVDDSKDFIYLLNKFIESPNQEFVEVMADLAQYIKATQNLLQGYRLNSSKEYNEFRLFLVSKKLGELANSVANEYIEFKGKDIEAQEHQKEMTDLLKIMNILSAIEGDPNVNH